MNGQLPPDQSGCHVSTITPSLYEKVEKVSILQKETSAKSWKNACPPSLYQHQQQSNCELRKCNKTKIRTQHCCYCAHPKDTAFHQNQNDYLSIAQCDPKTSLHERRKCSTCGSTSSSLHDEQQEQAGLYNEELVVNKEIQNKCDKKYPFICTTGQCNKVISTRHSETGLGLRQSYPHEEIDNHCIRADEGGSNDDDDDDDNVKSGISSKTFQVFYSPTSSTSVYTAKSTLSSSKNSDTIIHHNKTSNNVTISLAPTKSSSVTILLFNFILLSTFLANSLNYCHLVRGEIVLSKSTFVKENVSFAQSSMDRDQNHIIRNDYNSEKRNASVEDAYGKKHDFNFNYNSTSGKKGETKEVPPSSEDIFREMLSKPLDTLDRNVLLQAVWDALTSEEINRIFGQQTSSETSKFLNSVPNFDITKPQLTHKTRSKERRKKRSGASIQHDSRQHSEKLIQLEGFGRHFNLSIYPNQRLLDPYFVHLHRHQNRSEILSSELAQKQLKCFYHGSATHHGTENDVELGAVAMSLCGGMKGFILPSSLPPSNGTDGSSGQQYHYVIHPLPDRLLKSVPATSGSVDREESQPNASDNEGHDRHHIIFRRPSTLKIQLPSLSNFKPGVGAKATRNAHTHKSTDGNTDKRNNFEESKADASNTFELTTCMHHDNTQDSQFRAEARMKYDGDSNKNNNDGNNYNHDISGGDTPGNGDSDHNDNNQNDELDPILSSARRTNPIILSDAYYTDPSINDLERESLTEDQKGSLSSPTYSNRNGNVGHDFRRRPKRSTSFNIDTDTIDPFTYKPINVAPDSYWMQYRDRDRGGIRGSSLTSASNFNSRRLSSQFSYDENGNTGPPRFSSSSASASAPSSSFRPSFWQHQQNPRNIHASTQHNLAARPSRGSRYDEVPTAPEYDDTGVAGSDMTWSKGILVFESSGSASDEDRHYPGKDVPFYTKNSANKRKVKGISTTSSVVASTSSTSSTSSNSGGSNGNTRSFDWFGSGVSAGDSPRGSTTPLDKNKTTIKSYSVSTGSDSQTGSRKGRRDDGLFGDKWKTSLDSEIVWADRSNEINKQSRLDDLSNVKDRAPSHLTIETAVFVDKDLYKHMKQNFPEDTQGEVTRIVLAMINAVQLLYQDPSLGHRVDFVLKRLEVLETDPPSLLRPYDIDRFLTNFCKWQKTENAASDEDPLHWDHALILTGLDLYVVHQSGKISNQVVGLAPVAGMCTRLSSCTVNEGRHFESVFVVAHEIGHNLGMRHDGPQAENNCDPTSHIMSPTLGSGKITWSPCSKKYLDLFLDKPQAKCLFDKAKSERWLDHEGDGRLPGERFDADRQCVLKYGRGSFHATQQPLEDVCRDLHCRREFFTWTSHPALDGTKCSAADDMWCRAGKCVTKVAGPSSLSSYELSGVGNSGSNHDGFSGSSNHLPGSETAAYVTQKALDGGWGKWSPYTDCSSACLHSDDGTLTMGSNGVRLAARRCDSPRPENGGRQCSGPDRRYKTCATHKICTKNPSRTTVSQYAREVCNRAAQVDTELTGRGYMSSSNDPERACSVWCETNDNSGPRSRGWSFPDGTACKLMSLPKNSQTFCVAGKCQEFSCNPYSHFRLSEDDCAFTSTNDIIPKNSDVANYFGGPSGGVKINHRSGKVGWTDWEVQSDCKLACLAPAKGLQLVKRQCASDDALCGGLSLSVRLCKPDKYTVQTNGCSRLQTPFEYATKVCSKYSEKVSGLSGIGMQLSPTKDDTDRPCRIGCQDASIAYRFYMVNGEEGWFPAGTDCSRGDQGKKAYCMAGKCVDFGEDDTPMYQLNNNMMGSLFQQPRNKRQAVYNIMEPLKTDPGLDESSLKQLVQKFSQDTGNYPSLIARSRSNQRRPINGGSVDFSKPVTIQSSASISSPILYPSSSRNVPYTYNAYPETSNLFLTKQKSSRDAYTSGKGSGHNRGRSLDMDFVDVKSEWESNSNPSTFGHRSGAPTGTGDFTAMTGGYRSQPIEGSYYEWRKIVSDCSVACGTGIQEVIVQCISGDTVVNDSLCQGRPRPGFSGYVNCHKEDCARSSAASTVGNENGSHIWNWIQSILPPKNMSSTNGRTY